MASVGDDNVLQIWQPAQAIYDRSISDSVDINDMCCVCLSVRVECALDDEGNTILYPNKQEKTTINVLHTASLIHRTQHAQHSVVIMNTTQSGKRNAPTDPPSRSTMRQSPLWLH